jgi:hypothetical protein
MKERGAPPNLALRDMAGWIGVLILAAALIAAAFVTHGGPLILVAVLVLLIFGLLRAFRERGREAEAREVAQALRTHLRKGERLEAYTIGDRRRFKPLATLTDLALLLFTQGLAAESSVATSTDDTLVGLTDQRLIAIERSKHLPGKRVDWRERLNLRRRDRPGGVHALLFEAPREGTCLWMRLAVFYLARISIETRDKERFGIGVNSRFWAEHAFGLIQALASKTERPATSKEMK